MSAASMVGGTSHTLVTLQIPVSPDLLNHLGVVRCGELLKYMDIAACMSAERHSFSSSVTLSMDDVNFSEAKAKCGDLVVIRSRVNRAFTSSMEVGLRVEIENPETGVCRHLCSSYFVFVALDASGNKVQVPPLTPLTDKEKVRWALAAERRQIRLDHAKIVQQVIKDKATNLRYSVPSPREGQNGPTPLVSPQSTTNRNSVVRFGEMDDRRNEVTQMVLPQHANHYGNTFGGQIMCWAHEVAEAAAARHARQPVLTVSIDDLYFLAPSKVGTRVVLKGSVNRVFNRSMEVGVRVEGHHLNGDVVVISRAYFTMVAVEPPPQIVPQVSTPQPVQPDANGKKSSSLLFGKKSDKSAPSPQPVLPRTESRLQPIRTVPLNTPDQIRRHDEALGRRRVRLERLQLKKSNHLAWPFTPDTNPRAFVLENLKTLEKVTFTSESEAETLMEKEQGVNVPKSPTLNRGLWEEVAESEGVTVWAKASISHGVSLRTQCEIRAPFEAVIFSVLDVGSRLRWDKMVVGMEVRHRFEKLDADIAWLAVDMRSVNPSSKPTDFALLRSWKRQGNTFVIASHSVVHHSVPITTNHVRAETASSGFLVREMSKNVIDVQYVVQLNPSGTSIVAGELVGQTQMYAKRMKSLAEYAQSLHPEVYLGDATTRAMAPTGISDDDISKGSDKNCSIM